LISKVPVCCHKHLESLLFGDVEERAVLEARPATLKERDHLMTTEMPAQRGQCALVEEDAHSSRGQSTSRDMLQDSMHLLDCDAREPCDKVSHGCTTFEVFKEGGDRHSRTLEDPGSADTLRVTLNSRTGRPVDHGAP